MTLKEINKIKDILNFGNEEKLNQLIQEKGQLFVFDCINVVNNHRNDCDKENKHYSFEPFRLFLLSNLKDEKFLEHLKEDKAKLLNFIALMTNENYGQSFGNYLTIKEKGLLGYISDRELFENQCVYYYNNEIEKDYFSDKTQEEKFNRIKELMQFPHHTTTLFTYLRNYIDDDNKTKEKDRLNEIINLIFKQPDGSYSKFNVMSYCACWRTPFIEIIKERKDEFFLLVKDDYKYIKDSEILFFVISVLRNDFVPCQMIAAGMWVTSFKEMMDNYSKEEIKSMLKDFKVEYPNLFEILYTKNKCIRKSKKGNVRGFFETLLIEINLSDNGSANRTKRRI